MLNPGLDRRVVTRSAIFAIVIAAVCITLPLAALLSAQAQNPAPAQALAGRLTGTVADASGAAVARATVIVSTVDGRTVNVSATSPTGTFNIFGLPAGQYVVQVFASGFGPSRMTNIELAAGKDLQQDLKMDIGFVQSTAQQLTPGGTVNSRYQVVAGKAIKVTTANDSSLTAGTRGSAPETGRVSGTTLPPPPPPPPSRIRQGGNVQGALLLTQAKPVYPLRAKEARIQGVVILEAVISREGFVSEIGVISGHPELQPAAVDAVAQWVYRPTMLNGVPVEVVTTVTVNFAFQQ